MENQVIHALISTEEYRESPDFMNVNLSDFALFLAVMEAQGGAGMRTQYYPG